MRLLQLFKISLKILQFPSILFLILLTFVIHADDDKDLLIECHQKYQQVIRERTGSLSMQLKEKVTARSKLIDEEIKKDAAYKDEIASLKEEKKQKGNDKSTSIKYREARNNGVKRVENKSEIKQLSNEIKDLKKDIDTIIKDIVKDDKECKKCLAEK